MPLPDDGGLVAGSLHEVGQGGGLLIDGEVAIRRGDSGAGFAKSVVAGEKGIARGGAGGSGAIAAGEALAPCRESINVRGLKGLCAVAGEVSKAKVVGHNDDDVWRLLDILCRGGRAEDEGGKCASAIGKEGREGWFFHRKKGSDRCEQEGRLASLGMVFY